MSFRTRFGMLLFTKCLFRGEGTPLLRSGGSFSPKTPLPPQHCLGFPTLRTRGRKRTFGRFLDYIIITTSGKENEPLAVFLFFLTDFFNANVFHHGC